MIERRKTRQIKVGWVKIGGDAPVVVQSMTSTKTHELEPTLEQIKRLHKAGCEIIRVYFRPTSVITITLFASQVVA